MKRTINMMSSAYKIKGQGVLSAYEEQVKLIRSTLNEYEIKENELKTADIMHYHTIDPKFLISLPFVKITSTSVGYVHFLPETLENSIKLPKLFKNIFYKYVILFYKSMDHLITVNPYFIERLENYGIKKEKITYIPNYVSSDNFYKMGKAEKLNMRKKYSIPNDKFVVLSVGQLQKRKGIFDLIELAKSMPDIIFVWAGGFSFKQISDGYKELKRIVENPPDNVIFLGIVPRENMNEIYNLADIMFLPSYEELFPMTILEAASCRIPILLRDIELYKGILEGYYLKGSNNDDFKNEILKLKSDEVYYNKGCKMAQKCNTYYSAESVSAMWKTYYNRIYKINRKKRFGRKINEA